MVFDDLYPGQHKRSRNSRLFALGYHVVPRWGVILAISFPPKLHPFPAQVSYPFSSTASNSQVG